MNKFFNKKSIIFSALFLVQIFYGFEINLMGKGRDAKRRRKDNPLEAVIVGDLGERFKIVLGEDAGEPLRGVEILDHKFSEDGDYLAVMMLTKYRRTYIRVIVWNVGRMCFGGCLFMHNAVYKTEREFNIPKQFSFGQFILSNNEMYKLSLIDEFRRERCMISFDRK